MSWKGTGNSPKCNSANFSARRSQSGMLAESWHVVLWRFGSCLLRSTKPCFPILEIEHDKGKCTLFYCCFGHYRILAYKIAACEVCIIWRKPTEASKNPLPIVESRTGKPAMVTLKIELDCSTAHDTTLWANIYVRSQLGRGTDSVFIGLTKYFKDAKAMQINRILKIS